MIKINLLAEKKKKKRIRRPANILILTAAITAVTFVLAGAAVFYLKSEVSKLKSKSETNKAAIAELTKKINEVKRFEQLNKEIEQRNALIETLRKNQSVPVRVLDNVSAAIPEGVWLTSMTHKDSGIGLEGYAFTNIAIVFYVENLKKTENFIDVYLEESRQAEVEKVQVYKFKLNFKVKV